MGNESRSEKAKLTSKQVAPYNVFLWWRYGGNIVARLGKENFKQSFYVFLLTTICYISWSISANDTISGVN